MNDKQFLKILTEHWKSETGKPVSDLDRAYKRGWRDCIRRLRASVKECAAPPGKQTSAQGG